MTKHKLYATILLTILLFVQQGISTGEESEYAIGCLMPEAIPDALRIFYNETSWNALRQRQAAQMAKRGGCPHSKNELSCPIISRAIVTLSGKCRYLDNTPMCAVFDRRYHEATTMWPRHRDCTPLTSRYRTLTSRRYQYDAVTDADKENARKRAQNGVLPSNLDSTGRALPSRTCTVRQKVKTEKQGNCALLRSSVYGCRAGTYLQLWHPACAYLVKNKA